MAGTYVALLRAVNVGGKNKLPMKDLVAMFAAAGCSEVRSYIQSGNVVFGAKPALAGRIPEVIGKAVSDRFGFSSPVIVRSAGELAEVARANPFLVAAGAAADTSALHVAFLAVRPSAAQIAALDPNRSPPDVFIVRGREIYLQFPNGAGRTKLSVQYFDAKLGTVSTVRNWRTVLTLREMAGG